jgi:hypothetical protein
MESRGPRKPVEVTRAVTVLWAALALGPVTALVDMPYLRAQADPLFLGLIMVAVIAISVVLISQISRGRNWARITYLALTAIGSLPYVSLLGGQFGRSPVLGGLSLAQMGLQIVALWWLFTRPGKTWFTASHA